MRAINRFILMKENKISKKIFFFFESTFPPLVRPKNVENFIKTVFIGF